MALVEVDAVVGEVEEAADAVVDVGATPADVAIIKVTMMVVMMMGRTMGSTMRMIMTMNLGANLGQHPRM
jgi:hypothetical protein